MTWLGKILTIVVMIAALAWMYFTVQAYVMRTNWKTALEKFKDAAEKSEKARVEEHSRNLSNEDAYKRLLVIEQTKTGNLQKQVDDLKNANKTVSERVEQLEAIVKNGDVTAVKLQANLQSSLDEMDLVRARNTALEDKTTQLVLNAENAKREMVKAQNEAKLFRANAEDLAKKNDELQTKVAELRQSGGTLRAQIEKPPPPVLSNLRGEVEQVRGDIVILDIGIDAGLSKGTVLDLKRMTGGGRYLGTVKVTEVTPKQAVATFIPADSRLKIAQLRPEQLPKKGDIVEPSESAVGGVITPGK